jgi:ParB-like chromosome segregation protein Spo0J
MEIEIGHLVLKYADLRVLDPGRVGRLAAALAREGQRSPVLVVGDGVLVDGYHRVAALTELARDLVQAVKLEVSEAEALVLSWRLETGRRKTALEEGWLLVELAESHGRSQGALAAELRRPKSWVSQRIGLVRVLPEKVQDAVRSARIPAQAAMKSLLPMARIDASACERLVEGQKEVLTVRQWDKITGAWKKSDAEGRRRIEQNPLLLLKTDEAVAPATVDAEEKLLRDLEGIAGLCRRARRQASEGLFARANTGQLRAGFTQAQEAFHALKEEVLRAESRNA